MHLCGAVAEAGRGGEGMGQWNHCKYLKPQSNVACKYPIYVNLPTTPSHPLTVLSSALSLLLSSSFNVAAIYDSCPSPGRGQGAGGLRGWGEGYVQATCSLNVMSQQTSSPPTPPSLARYLSPVVRNFSLTIHKFTLRPKEQSSWREGRKGERVAGGGRQWGE